MAIDTQREIKDHAKLILKTTTHSFSHGPLTAAWAAKFLDSLHRAYISIYAFEAIFVEPLWSRRVSQLTLNDVELAGVFEAEPGLKKQAEEYPTLVRYIIGKLGKLEITEWPWHLLAVMSVDDTVEMLTSGGHKPLIIKTVKISSPGVWEFLGKFNPLEIIRLWLQDRHERFKDKSYRIHADAEKLQLENLLLKARVINDWMATLKKMGASDGELRILIDKFVEQPLLRLGRFGDRINLVEVESEESQNKH
jgi:hypothetical protein